MAYINGNEILFSAIINGSGGGGGEAIPNFNEVEGFRVFLEGLEGEINVGYSVLEKVALPAGYPAILASLSDKNFIADNIKKGVNIFGLVGAFGGEGNQWLGEYVDGTGYKTGAIVSYEGNIYICIKDLDDMQDPTNANYWRMLNEAGSGEDIPEISEPLTLIASKEGAEEGELVIAYNLSQKSALPAGTNEPLGFVKDANFIADNIRKGRNIFGLEGAFEGESSGGGTAIETGTLTIVGGFENEFDIVYSTYSNGSITSVHEYIDGMGTGDAIFTGILLGTPIVLYTPRGEYLDDGDIQGVTEVSFTENTNCGVYKLTASNATASFL